MPQVTFENTMIVAVFLGTRPSAGYAVDVVNAGTCWSCSTPSDSPRRGRLQRVS